MPIFLTLNNKRRWKPMLQIAVCEDEQADMDNLIEILKTFLSKYTEE